MRFGLPDLLIAVAATLPGFLAGAWGAARIAGERSRPLQFVCSNRNRAKQGSSWTGSQDFQDGQDDRRGLLARVGQSSIRSIVGIL